MKTLFYQLLMYFFLILRSPFVLLGNTTLFILKGLSRLVDWAEIGMLLAIAEKKIQTERKA